MKCINCDNPKELKTRRETLRYKECGLENVVLYGVKIDHCDKCGETYHGYGDIEALHAKIAETLIHKTEKLNGAEVRFLRSVLGYSGEMYASLVGIRRETLSRIENGKVPTPKYIDVALRALVATKMPSREYDFHDKLLNYDWKHFDKIELHARSGGWDLKRKAS